MAQEAVDAVKIGWFIKSGYTLHGVVHVGAGDGYEVPFYRELGLDPVICFEPLADARRRFKERNPTESECLPYALSDFNGTAQLNIAPGDGQDSSLLEEVKPVPDRVRRLPQETVEVIRFDAWTGKGWGWDKLWTNGTVDTLVIDVQGAELQVLKGLGDWLNQFRYLNIECSKVPIYKTGASAQEVIDFLTKAGFTAVTPISEHDDILFVHSSVLLPPVEVPTIHDEIPQGTMLNIGSGQRRFDTGQGWVNIDMASRPPDQIPDLICDVGRETLPYADGSMDICVLHHVLEHFGCGEANQMLKDCWRVLRPEGSLLVFVPNAWALAQRYVLRQIDNYIYNVNIFGAYQGEEQDRHRWSYDYASLQKLLKETLGEDGTEVVKFFNWRGIPGASLAQDWWVLALECVKEVRLGKERLG